MVKAKKRILHLITGLEVGGAENMLLKTLPATSDSIDHHVCSIVGVGPIGDKLSATGIPVYPLNLNFIFDLAIIPRLKNLINEIQPDVLITYLPHADLLGRILGKITGIPTIVSSIRVRLTKSKYLPFFIIDGLTSPLVDHYHFNSQTTASIHQRLLGINRRKITVIPNAINVEQFNANVAVNAKKRELGLPPHKIIIGCVARLRRQKGHLYLIKAFAKTNLAHPDTALVLVGDGEEKDNITQQINGHNLQDSVFMLGNRHDIPSILATFDIFCLTTLYEGMSNSIMEAMSAKLPVITTDIPENRELITHLKNGLLVPAKDSTATAKAINSLIDNPSRRQALGYNAWRDVKRNFSLSVIIPRYRSFYQHL